MIRKLWRVVVASLRVIWAVLYGGWRARRDLKRWEAKARSIQYPEDTYLSEQLDQEAKQ